MLRRTFLQAGTLAPAYPLESAEFLASPQNIRGGRAIPGEGYRDRRYIVISADGNRLCALTGGQGIHGEIRRCRHSNRYLATSEAVGNLRAGM